ncbi:MAG: ATP-binding protein [Spirochaeta sp.]|jgi:signal transduction histidine kinase|nr:ATP-binding protein [Spirochaeta sp.]
MLSTIQAKIVTAIVLVLVVGVSAATVISIRTQRTNLLEAQQQELANNSNTLNISVRNVMLAGEAPVAVSLLQDLSEAPGFDALEIYRRDGSIAFSDFSTMEEVNRNLGGEAFPETPRRTGTPDAIVPVETVAFEEAVTFNTPRIVEDLEAQQLEYYFPILNYSECRQCHGTDHFVRGVAYYDVSLDSVFDRIGNARNTLLILYIAMTAAIALALVTLMQQIVIVPIRSIGRVVGRVGEGDLDVQADVAGSSEFRTLSQKINAMIGGLKERNRLEVQNSVIEARDEENRKYLDNIAEGLLLIDRDHRISEQYSRYVEELFATTEIAGRSFVDFIYPDTAQPGGEADARHDLARFLTMVFENTATEMEMIMSINPLAEQRLTVGDGGEQREIVVDTHFQRIFADDGTVERVMVIFEDLTDIVRTRAQLESERQRYKSDIEHIATLLKTGPEAYQEFSRDVRRTIELVEQTIEGSAAGESRNTVLRELHSLKGTARYLEFYPVAELAHAAEDAISDGGDVAAIVERLREEMENLDTINERFRSFAAVIAPEDTARAALSDFLEHIERMSREIAAELEKGVVVQIDNELTELSVLSRLKNPIIHLVRNAIDHGIEDEYERLAAGKSNPATITLAFSESETVYVVSIGDDGRGIDFDAVRRTAVERGVLAADRTYTRAQLVKTLFAPSFSTRGGATEISGRGVGLDVVQEEIRSLGGKISLRTRAGEGTRFTLTVPKGGQS